MNDTDLNNTFVALKINSKHEDLIHDVSFDFYGRRMATCSSDQTVKVWDLNEADEWVCTASWKSHNASVWKVTWAHPEFGQVLATCSFDRMVSIWEERITEDTIASKLIHNWVFVTNLIENKSSVKDVKFSPKHLGLQIATCSSNGVIRIYEAPDAMNLTQWSMQHEIDCKISCSCISWNPSVYRHHAPMIAVGSDDTSNAAEGKVFIFEYNDSIRDWVKIQVIMKITDPVSDLCFAPNLGKKHHVLAIASNDLHIYNLNPISDDLGSQQETESNNLLSIQQVAHLIDHNCKVTRLSWNDFGTVLLSTAEDGQVFLWMANYVGIWKRVGSLKHESALPPSPHHVMSVATPKPKTKGMNIRRLISHRGPPPSQPLAPVYADAYY